MHQIIVIVIIILELWSWTEPSGLLSPAPVKAVQGGIDLWLQSEMPKPLSYPSGLLYPKWNKLKQATDPIS